MIFDLDQRKKVAWLRIPETALLVRILLHALDLQAFLKTNAKALHVVVPLKKLHGLHIVNGLTQAVVQHLAKTIPRKFVAKRRPKIGWAKFLWTTLETALR